MVLTFLVFATACGDDSLVSNCSDTVAINAAITDETDKLTDVLTAFSTDPTTSNCNELRSAYTDYIDALKGLQGCANEAGVGDEFRESITEAEVSLQTVECG